MVALPFFGPEAAVGLSLENVVLETGCLVALDVGLVAQDGYHVVDNHGLGGTVGVETVVDGGSFADFYGVGAGVEVGVCAGEGVEYVLGVVAVGVFGFEGVALDDEEGFLIPGGYLCGFPDEEVVVDVAIPLCDDFGYSAVDLPIAVEDKDNGIVGLAGTASDIDDGDVAAGDGKLFGVLPDGEMAGGVVVEVKVGEGGGAFGVAALGGYLADGSGRGTVFFEPLDKVFVEDAFAGGGKGFDVVGGKLGHHLLVGLVGASFLAVPSNGFEGGAFFPEEVLVRGEGIDERGVVVDGQGVDGYVVPGDKEGLFVGASLLGGLVFVVEIVAFAFGGGLHDDHGVGGEGYGGDDGADEVGGAFLRGVGEHGDFGEVYHVDVLGTDAFGGFGGTDGYLAVGGPDDGDVLPVFEGLEAWGFASGEQVGGIVLQELGVHAFDGGGAVFDVGADDTVPRGFVDELYPGHVYLCEGGASPLTGLDEYDANGTAGEALAFVGVEEDALGVVEDEVDGAGGEFVGDVYEGGGPELEVVPDTDAYELFFDFGRCVGGIGEVQLAGDVVFDGGVRGKASDPRVVVEHGGGEEEPADVGQMDLGAGYGGGAFSGDGVVGGGIDAPALLVFLEVLVDVHGFFLFRWRWVLSMRCAVRREI